MNDRQANRYCVLVEVELPPSPTGDPGKVTTAPLADHLRAYDPGARVWGIQEGKAGVDAAWRKLHQLSAEIERGASTGLMTHSAHKAMSFFRDIFPASFWRENGIGATRNTDREGTNPVSDDKVTVSREALTQLFGRWALPPWSDADGNHWLGGDVDCAPLARQIATDIEALVAGRTPPSLVAPGLRNGLQDLVNEYGMMGVCLTIEEHRAELANGVFGSDRPAGHPSHRGAETRADDKGESVTPDSDGGASDGWIVDPADPRFLPDLVESAWGIIANAGCAHSPVGWTQETPEWQSAAAAWRQKYHAWLASICHPAATTVAEGGFRE